MESHSIASDAYPAQLSHSVACSVRDGIPREPFAHCARVQRLVSRTHVSPGEAARHFDRACVLWIRARYPDLDLDQPSAEVQRILSLAIEANLHLRHGGMNGLHHLLVQANTAARPADALTPQGVNIVPRGALSGGSGAGTAKPLHNHHSWCRDCDCWHYIGTLAPLASVPPPLDPYGGSPCVVQSFLCTLRSDVTG